LIGPTNAALVSGFGAAALNPSSSSGGSGGRSSAKPPAPRSGKSNERAGANRWRRLAQNDPARQARPPYFEQGVEYEP